MQTVLLATAAALLAAVAAVPIHQAWPTAPWCAGLRTRTTAFWQPTDLDQGLGRTLVGSQEDPDCLGREPVAFCG